MVVRIHAAIEGQIVKVRATMEEDRIKTPGVFRRMNPQVKLIFRHLFHNVSDRALHKLWDIWEDIKAKNYEEHCEDYWMRECQGLPCIHEMVQHIIQKKPFKLNQIHRFWRQLQWDRIELDNGEVEIGVLHSLHQRASHGSAY